MVLRKGQFSTCTRTCTRTCSYLPSQLHVFSIPESSGRSNLLAGVIEHVTIYAIGTILPQKSKLLGHEVGGRDWSILAHKWVGEPYRIPS